MKNITLKSLELTNFKGIKSFSIKDLKQEVSIYGANGSGKTTLFDAFTWLLFGKDSQERTAFEIKTLDTDNNPIPKIDHEVEGTFGVAGKEIKLTRTFREKWVKKRGNPEAEFTGHETIFQWNDVPVSASEYAAKVHEIVNENVFKLITSPTAFTSQKWQDQREILVSLIDNLTDEDVAKKDKSFSDLLNKISGISLDEFQKQVSSKIRKAKEELKMIPARVDEVERSKPEPKDFVAIRKEIDQKKTDLQKIEGQISSSVEASKEIYEQKEKKQKEIYSLKHQIEKEKNEAETELASITAKSEAHKRSVETLKSEIETGKSGLATLTTLLTAKDNEIIDAKTRVEKLRAEWAEVNALEFTMPDGSTACPCCSREFEAGQVEQKITEAKAKFQADKKEQLTDISSRGKRLSEIVKALELEKDQLQVRVEKGKVYVAEKTDELKRKEAETPDVKTVDVSAMVAPYIEAISLLTEEMESITVPDMSEIKQQKTALQSEIDLLNSALNAEKQIEEADKRKSELMNQEKAIAQAISDLERDQFTAEKFVKAKMEAMEESINAKFSIVKFKLFETQINGSEIPTCKALINGVPYSDANTASRINAGIDIINTLSKRYEVSAPIFIDGRESVTELIPTESQVINLIVSPEHEKLTVE